MSSQLAEVESSYTVYQVKSPEKKSVLIKHYLSRQLESLPVGINDSFMSLCVKVAKNYYCTFSTFTMTLGKNFINDIVDSSEECRWVISLYLWVISMPVWEMIFCHGQMWQKWLVWFQKFNPLIIWLPFSSQIFEKQLEIIKIMSLPFD